MDSATLYRVSKLPDATFGVLVFSNSATHPLTTLEDPDNNNRPFASCIPTGVYGCVLIESPTKGHVYEVQNVPNRTHILIHVGNTAADTEGCILLGRSYGVVNGTYGILRSEEAVAEFMQHFAGAARIQLIVKDVA